MWVKLDTGARPLESSWVRLDKLTSGTIDSLPQDRFYMVSLGLKGSLNYDEVLNDERVALIRTLKGKVAQELEDPPVAFGHCVDIHDPFVIAGDR